MSVWPIGDLQLILKINSIKNVSPVLSALFLALIVSTSFAAKNGSSSRQLTTAISEPQYFTNQSGRFESETGFAHALYNVNLTYPALSTEQAALQVMTDLSVQFGGATVTENLEIAAVKQSPAGTHVHLQQTVNGIPVHNARFNISFDHQNTVRMITGNPVPEVLAQVLSSSISSQQALDITRTHLGITGEPLGPPTVRTMYYRDNQGEDHLAEVVYIASLDPMGDWEVIVDATNGNVLAVADHMCFVDGTGMVFAPDPLTTAGVRYGGDYVDNGDLDSPELNNERIEVTLEEITEEDGVYSLSGPWVSLLDFEDPVEPPVTSDSPDGFNFLRSESGFEDVMVYYHISNSQLHMQSLGFDDIQHGPIEADPHGLGGDDNSHFIPTLNRLAFGEGGVDDAEDCDVIIHEYGHAIQHDQVPGWTGGHTASLGEGFGDYWAGSYSIRYNDYYSHWTFNWDGHNPFWAGRRLDFPGVYPDNWSTNDIYHNGQIWASTLWEIRADVGGDETDAIVLQAHYYLTTGATAVDNAESLVLADQLLFDGEHEESILNALYTRGFLTPPPEYGSIAGQITESETGDPLTGATITLFGTEEDYETTSGANGNYTLEEVLAGNYTVEVSLANYVTWTGEAEILTDQQTVLNVEIGQPSIHVTPNDLELEVFINESLDTTVTLVNTGTGTATWGMRLRDREEPVIEPWSSPSSFDIDEALPFGLEVVNGNYIVSGANGSEEPNKLYVLTPREHYWQSMTSHQPQVSATVICVGTVHFYGEVKANPWSG